MSCDWEVDVVEVVVLVDRDGGVSNMGTGRVFQDLWCVCMYMSLSGCPATKKFIDGGVYRWCAVLMQLVVCRRQIATRLPLAAAAAAAAANCSQATLIVCLLSGKKKLGGGAWLTGMHLQC